MCMHAVMTEGTVNAIAFCEGPSPWPYFAMHQDCYRYGADDTCEVAPQMHTT